MKKLDRVAVWALMSGGGDGKDVFLVSTAWSMLAVNAADTSCNVKMFIVIDMWPTRYMCCQLSRSKWARWTCCKDVLSGNASRLASRALAVHSLVYTRTAIKTPTPYCHMYHVLLQEASIAWEKRKAAARASAQAAQDRQTFAGFWGDFAGASGARMYEEAGRACSSTDGGDGTVGGGKEGARIANLAAKAARAARQWKNFQEFQQRSRRLQLTVSSSGSTDD